jgi:hypothetical protein
MGTKQQAKIIEEEFFESVCFIQGRQDHSCHLMQHWINYSGRALKGRDVADLSVVRECVKG